MLTLTSDYLILDQTDQDEQRRVIQLALAHLQKRPCADFVKMKATLKAKEAELAKLRSTVTTLEAKLEVTTEVLHLQLQSHST